MKTSKIKFYAIIGTAFCLTVFFACKKIAQEDQSTTEQLGLANKLQAASKSFGTAYTPTQYRNLLGVGMDVDWAKTGAGLDGYNYQTAVDFKARGFSHVRIRVKDNANAELLDSLEVRVSDCLANNLIPIIAYQANDFKNNPNSTATLNAAVNWWSAVANRFKNYSSKLSFDLLIECTDSLNSYQGKLNEYFEKSVTAIRATNPNRILMISPRVRSNPVYLTDLVIPTQANGYLMAEWHFYAAGPSKTNPVKLWTTGTAAEKQLITDAINTAYSWQTANNIPTWVGAWMPGDYNDGDHYTAAEQVVFSTFLSCKLKEKGIPYAVNSDTKFYDGATNTWISSKSTVVDSFLNPICP